MAQGYNTYQKTSIDTADRGKLIIMIYDHCIKWCKVAKECIEDKTKIQESTKAIFKVQDGITELTCSLDMEKGGKISENLYNLYSFYNRHLSHALKEHKATPIQEVHDMLMELRGAWLSAIDTVRKQDRATIQQSPSNQIKMVG